MDGVLAREMPALCGRVGANEALPAVDLSGAGHDCVRRQEDFGQEQAGRRG